MEKRLIDYLRRELGIAPAEIHLALSQVQEATSQLPISLWRYGIINLGQLEQIFDWLETPT